MKMLIAVLLILSSCVAQAENFCFLHRGRTAVLSIDQNSVFFNFDITKDIEDFKLYGPTQSYSYDTKDGSFEVVTYLDSKTTDGFPAIVQVDQSNITLLNEKREGLESWSIIACPTKN